MEKLQLMMNTSWAASFGETILHSLWQGALILGIYLILSRRFRNSQQRVNLWLFVLLGQLVISLITFFILYDNQVGNVAAFQSMSKLEPANFSMNAWISANSPYLYAAWLIGFTFLCIKYFLAYFYVLWLKNSKSSALSYKSQLAVEFLKKQLTFDFENVKIVESAKVNTAMVLGHLKPVILLPIALVNRLSIEQVEVVLAHELAHVKRNDFFINLGQTLVESIFFFHPVYWFIGNQIRENRELACDELAAEWTGKGVILAKTHAVISLHQNQPDFAMTFGKKKMPTLYRIQTLLGYRNENQKSKFVALILMFTMLTAFGFSKNSEDTTHIEIEKITAQAPDEIQMEEVLMPAKIDTSIKSKTIKRITESSKIRINTDDYDVRFDENGIIINGEKMEMSEKEEADFRANWKGFIQSQQALKEMSKIIEKDAKAIGKMHAKAFSNFNPADTPEFKKYIAAVSEKGREMGKLGEEMSAKIKKVDVNDRNYEKKVEKIAKAYEGKMKDLEREMEAMEPEMKEFEKKMEQMEIEIERNIEIPSKEMEERINLQAEKMDKVAEQMEIQHEKLFEMLPEKVKKDLESMPNIIYDYPSPPAAPIAPVSPVAPGNLNNPPQPPNPPVPPVAPRD